APGEGAGEAGPARRALGGDRGAPRRARRPRPPPVPVGLPLGRGVGGADVTGGARRGRAPRLHAGDLCRLAVARRGGARRGWHTWRNRRVRPAPLGRFRGDRLSRTVLGCYSDASLGARAHVRVRWA